MAKDFTLVIQGGGTRAAFCLGAALELKERGYLAGDIIGTSAGSLIGMMYLLDKIDLVEEVFLSYMADSRFVGAGNMLKSRNLFNFEYFYEDLKSGKCGLDIESFYGAKESFTAVATSCETGEPAYFEKGKCDILKGIAASCSIPLFARPVEIEGLHYLDGGTVESLPFHKPLKEGKKKIVLISSRPHGYRKSGGTTAKGVAAKAFYSKYPKWNEAYRNSIKRYNEEVELLLQAETEGKIFSIYPEKPVDIGIAETDRYRLLGAIYLGRKAVDKNIAALEEYLCR